MRAESGVIDAVYQDDFMRLLFLDDEPERIEILRPTLEDVLDAEVIVATSVAEGVAALRAAPTDLVVFDVFMPLGDSPREVLGPRARRLRHGAATAPRRAVSRQRRPLRHRRWTWGAPITPELDLLSIAARCAPPRA